MESRGSEAVTAEVVVDSGAPAGDYSGGVEIQDPHLEFVKEDVRRRASIVDVTWFTVCHTRFSVLT